MFKATAVMSEMVYCFICGTAKSTILFDMTFLLASLLIRVAKVKCWIIIDDPLYTYLHVHIIICVFLGCVSAQIQPIVFLLIIQLRFVKIK